MECIILDSDSHKKGQWEKQLPLTSLFGLHAQSLLQVFLCVWESSQYNSIFSVSQVVVTAF